MWGFDFDSRACHIGGCGRILRAAERVHELEWEMQLHQSLLKNHGNELRAASDAVLKNVLCDIDGQGVYVWVCVGVCLCVCVCVCV